MTSHCLKWRGFRSWTRTGVSIPKWVNVFHVTHTVMPKLTHISANYNVIYPYAGVAALRASWIIITRDFIISSVAVKCINSIIDEHFQFLDQ